MPNKKPPPGAKEKPVIASAYPPRRQEQPFRLLILLLARSGEIVSRDDLQKQLWPEDTFVEFDNSLNVAVRKLREAFAR